MNEVDRTPPWQGTLHVIAPSAPPKICGVGDHSNHLVSALAKRGRVLIHCGQLDPTPRFDHSGMILDFDHRFPWTLEQVADSSAIRSGETAFVQYTNFAYGRYGFNPWIAPALARLRHRRVRVVTMFHETYMNGSEGWKAAIMGWWQRRFFRQVGRNSDVCLFSTQPWAEQYASWFPGRPVLCLAVGSNIPPIPVDRQAHRARLGIPVGVPCLVVFGGTHPTRHFDWIAAASERLSRENIDHRVLHVGPDAQDVARLLAGVPLIELGVLSEVEVSKALSAGDIMMAPISDGASTRRGSLLAGLEHGLCCVSTMGTGTDALLAEQSGKALVLATGKEDFLDQVARLARDQDRMGAIGQAGAAFYRANFSWESVADRLVSTLSVR